MSSCISEFINPLLHRFFLDHDIIFYFKLKLKKKIKKQLSKVLNTFENIMKNEAFANASFPIIFSIHDISKGSKGVIME